MLHLLQQARTKLGLTGVADPGADPRLVLHIAEGADDEIASCGVSLLCGDDDPPTPMFAPLCPNCAAIHVHESWVQRNLR